MKGPGIVRLSTAQAVARAAARRVLGCAERAVAEHGRFTLALSGGSTPAKLYWLLASAPYARRLPWSRTTVLFSDERCVAPDDEQSNYRLARKTLLDRVDIPPEQIHRMQGELEEPAAAAAIYESTLRELFPGEAAPRFDLLLLGTGTDGHTASLFPGTLALQESSRWVVDNTIPGVATRRITLTVPALRGARHTLFLVTGARKARVVAESFGSLPHDPPHPCELVLPPEGTMEVLLDRPAAKLLPKT